MPLALLLAAAFACVPPPRCGRSPQGDGQPPAPRAVAPQGDELDKARRLVATVFRLPERAGPAASRDAQRALVRELREHARTKDTYPGNQVYALLLSAAELAEAIGDCELLEASVADLGARFQVDGAAVLGQAAVRMSRASPSRCPPIDLLPLLLESGRGVAATDAGLLRSILAEADQQVLRIDDVARRAELQKQLTALHGAVDRATAGATSAPAPLARKLDVPPASHPDRLRAKAAVAAVVAGLEGKPRRDKVPLIQGLIDKAAGSAEPPGVRYEHLVGALDAAGSAGDVESIVRATEELDRQFDVDRNQLLFAAGRKAQESKTGDAVKLARLFLDVCAACVDNRPRLCELSLAAATVERDRLRGSRREYDEASAAIRDLTERLEDLKREKAMRDALQKQPGDTAAVEQFGWFLCTRRNKWAEGLPMLAKGSTLRLGEHAAAALAQKELDKASSEEQLWEVAQAWRAWSELASTPRFERANVAHHVRELYRRLPGIQDLRRVAIDEYLAGPAPESPTKAAPAADVPKPTAPPDKAPKSDAPRADQSRSWFRTGKVLFGPQNWSITDKGITTPALNAAAASEADNTCMLVSGKPVRGAARISFEFPTRCPAGTRIALAFGVEGAGDFHLAEVATGAGSWLLQVYRCEAGQLRVLSEHRFAWPAGAGEYARFEVSLRGKEIVARVGEAGTVTCSVPTEIEGSCGIYVSGATKNFDPLELRNFHVDP